MREIVLDTETTGFDPVSGDRIVEIGCVELKNCIPTGNVYHVYINPERDMPQSAFEVHGLSEEFLKEHPVFSSVVEDFLEFLAEDPLVIHNAKFDMKFINHELKMVGKPAIPMSRTVDTLLMARKKFPGSPASLDALCR
ncbi:MAG: DNA polymerase III subunit epsilon, partial [Alphaproteobacteria bacterium]